MATRESLMGQWNHLEDVAQAERKFNDHIDQMFFDEVSNDIAMKKVSNEPRD